MPLSKDSIFYSFLKSFVNVFAVIAGLFVAVLLGVIMLTGVSQSSVSPDVSEMKIAADAEGRRELLPPSSPAVLLLRIEGVIGEGSLTTEKMADILLDSQENMLKNNRVKAVLLSVNTPGGTVTDSNGIYSLLMEYKNKYKVPIYAYVDGMCASGGMYICSAADKIFASDISVIGSVGVVFGPAFNFFDAMGKIGVKAETITQGKDKDMLNPFRQWKVNESSTLSSVTEALYENFVTIVTQARPRLSKDKLIEEYGAKVFVAKAAKEFGYIDEASSSYRTTLTALTAAANITEDTKYQVVELLTPSSFLQSLVHSKSPLLTGKLTHEFKIPSTGGSSLSGQFLYLYQPI